MNNTKVYLSLLGAFLFQIIALGIFSMLLKEPFFSKSNLILSIIATTTLSFFVLREQRKNASEN